MVSIGNKSKLATSEICQTCAKCCKTFSWSDNLDMAIRFMWMNDKDVVAEDTPFLFSDGTDIKTITLKKTCSRLEKKGNKYYCSAWDMSRPDFCNTYPDHIFVGVEITDRKRIQQIINFEKKTCPIFQNMTVDKVLKIMSTKNSKVLYE
jgi:Fe-S-cluster containining protein